MIRVCLCVLAMGWLPACNFNEQIGLPSDAGDAQVDPDAGGQQGVDAGVDADAGIDPDGGIDGGCGACAEPANATATCELDQCGFTCNAGYNLCAGACLPAATSHGALQASGSLSLGTPSPAIALADLNNDGTLDLIATYPLQGNVSVALGQGDGGFAGPVSYGAVTGVQALALADFDQDGFLDLAAGGKAQGQVAIFRGTGNGTLQSPTLHLASPTTTNDMRALVAGDFDSDGKHDLASGSWFWSVAVALGNGTGSFGTPQNSSDVYTPVSLVTADFNQDGHPDLAVGGSGLNILLAQGNGTFQATSLEGGNSVAAVAAADLNGDGIADLASVSESPGEIRVRLGNGNGTFQPPLSFPVASGSRTIAIADFNNDGLLDIAAGNSSYSVSVLYGAQGGTFLPFASYPIRAGSLEAVSNALAVGDLNGDGHPDLVVTNTYHLTAEVLLWSCQ